jgi:hypothetical protein
VKKGIEGATPLPLLILVGRPASGKSEIIDYLRRLPPGRREALHLGRLEVIDDFPMLWAWFEEDELLQRMGRPRLHTTADGYFREDHLWDLLVRRLCLEYDKARQTREAVAGGEGLTAILEFARGAEHGGYRRAFAQLSDEVLRRAAILYVRVSFEESLRKNRLRFNPRAPHSILEHSLPDSKMKRLYRDDDWQELCPGPSGHLELRGHRVPYVVFENEDDVTTPRGRALGLRLSRSLRRLWELGERKAVVEGRNPQ